jgi:hypothetical protein
MRKIFTATVLVLGCAILGEPGATTNAGISPSISPEQAKALAVNNLHEMPGGFRLTHPRRSVELTPQGLRLEGRRGAPAWTWQLASITSSTGAQIADPGPLAPLAVEPTLIRYDRCSILEEYRFKVDTVEQLFTIPEPLPLGGADLVVTGTIRCDGDLERTDDGWLWRGARGEVTLGEVTVLDAAGRQLPAHFEVTGTSTRVIVDGEGLLEANYPVVIDPELGSNDYRISDMGPDGDPDYDAFDAAIAYNSINNTYLVVWAGDDTQGGLIENEYEIFGQLLTGITGSQTGYGDVRISFAGGTGSAATRAFRPAVAFNSQYNQFLVVWSADNPEDGCVDNEFEIWGQVVDMVLLPLFGGNFRISFNGGSGDPNFDADYPAVVYNPDLDHYLVVWEGDHNGFGMVDGESEIWAQRVYSTGILVGSNLRMSDMGGSGDPNFGAFSPDVAYNTRDHEYLIVWQGDDDTGGLVDDEFEIYGQLIDVDGVGVGPNDYRLSDMGGIGDPDYDAFHPAVAYNSLNNEYLVVWQGDDNVGGLLNNEYEVFSQRLDADLGGLGSNDYRLSDVGGIGDTTFNVAWGPEVAYNRILNQYMVVWGGEDNVGGMVNNEWEIFAQMLTWNIQGLGPNDERISDACGIGELSCQTFSPVVAANTRNGQFMVAWHGDDTVGDMVLGEYEIFTQRMDGMAIFVDGFESNDTSQWDSAVP